MSVVKSIIAYEPETSLLQTVFRWLLGIFFLIGGIAHLGPDRAVYEAQVPPWIPLDTDFVIIVSGIMELGLAAILLLTPRYKAIAGWIVAAFLVAIFPGNISQYVNQVDAFTLDTDRARLIRLFFQPVFIAWALWCTGAWEAWKNRSNE
ncbi:MAG: DoxX family protein [Candidatus Kariarchaeaceae archaeon]|jgi:uncharacterized membrane protein